ncbi:hypothetical protein BGZ68_004208, partial [Mortierella alpina]
MSDSSSLSPCKVSLNGNLRRFLVSRPAAWADFVEKVRNVYSLPADAAFDVQYKDEEGDVITLNTDSELEDVLSMHTLFNQVAPVRFEIFPRDIQGIAAIALTEEASTRERSVTATSEPEEDTQVHTHSSNPHHNPFESYSSDDGSLIDFEDAVDSTTVANTPALDSNAIYPQQDLYEAALIEEQQEAEAYKLDAPIFPSSVASAVVHEGNNAMDITQPDKSEMNEEPTATSSPKHVSPPRSPVVVPVVEFEALRMDGAPEVMDSIVASAIEQHAQENAASAHSH